MTCSSHSNSEKNIMVGGGCKSIVRLVKVNSIKEANQLLNEDHVFLSAFYNQALDCPEYILGKLEGPQKKNRSIGFKV